MDGYLEKRMYVNRKSYNFYNKISILLLILKLIFSASGITSFYYFPLSFLSLITGIIEILERSINQNERLSEYKMSYKFYKQMINSFKAQKLTEEEIYLREKEFIENIQFFPREEYLKEAELNGYNFIQTCSPI